MSSYLDLTLDWSTSTMSCIVFQKASNTATKTLTNFKTRGERSRDVAWFRVRKVKQRMTYQDDADTITCLLPQEIFYFFADFNAIHG